MVRFHQGVPEQSRLPLQTVLFNFAQVCSFHSLYEFLQKYDIIVVTFYGFPDLIVERTVKM